MKLDSLDLFFGDANPAEARVYARVRLLGSNDSLHLHGRVSGPICDFARTLPANIPFTDRSQGATCLAEAVIPDPCFWTPELPFLYRANLELRQDDKSIECCERTIGLRRLGVRDRTLLFNGKRFVLRAVTIQSIETAAAFAKETWTALVVDRPGDELCNFASHRGILLVADLTVGTKVSDTAIQLRRLAKFPAVAIALIDANAALPADIRAVVPNLLLAQYIPNNQPMQLAPWAQLAFVEAIAPAAFAKKASDCKLPIIAVRKSSQPSTIEQSRAACDALQSELTPHGDFAGYAV